MKKIYLFTVTLLLSTFASWAAVDLSFTIWPEKSGTFTIFYSTYKAPSGMVVTVDWGSQEFTSGEKAETGSDPTGKIVGTATAGKPIKIYSNYLDAIYIDSHASAIKCESNNPHLQYIYYFKSNLSSEKLEALYSSLKDRNGKDWGELHISMSSNMEAIGNDILKSNAFITLGKKWYVCSRKAWTGNFSARTTWYFDENTAKAHLIPAITIKSPTTANITDLKIGVMPGSDITWIPPAPEIRIDDGTSNYKSVKIPLAFSFSEFESNAPKLNLKGTGESGLIKIYGAMVSHIKTSQINRLNLTNTTNLRYIAVNYCPNLTDIPGLSKQTLLEHLDLTRNTSFTSVDVRQSTKLKTLLVSNCWKLNQLYFNGTSLEYLSFSQCDKLKLAGLSTLKNASKLTMIVAENVGWDACAMDELYRDLRSPAPSGAEIYVEDADLGGDFSNDWEGSNKTIATAKGWSVMREYNGGAEQKLTGNGGGCIPVGISEVEADKFITVYPNPVSDVVNINIGQNMNAESLQVIDITGKTIFTAPLAPYEFEYQINVSDYTKGIYLIRIGNITRKLIVK